MAERHELDNGLTVLIDEMRDVRSLALGFFCKTGSADEPEDQRGISHFLEHLLFKRTRRRSSVEIARAVDRLGGDVNAFTTKEYTVFFAHTLDTHLESALDLLGDVVLSPAFDSKDLERERGVILGEIGEANDTPDDLVHEMFVKSFWKSHPLGQPILGTKTSVRGIGKGDLYDYHRRHYTPDNMIFSVAGHVRARDVLSGVEALFRRRSGQRPTRRRSASHVPKPNQHFSVRPRKGLEQVHLCLGTEAPPQLSDRRFAANVLDVVLGGGMSSRLFQEVREKRGLVYSIGSALNSYRLAGYETVYASCEPKNCVKVFDTIFRQLRKLKVHGVRPGELSRAKENLKGDLLLALESTVSRMSAQARQEFYYGRLIPTSEWIGRIEAVTADDVGSEAEKLFDRRVLSISVVGNVENLPLSLPHLATALA
jgi:predicted Zn-dependent peptidase